MPRHSLRRQKQKRPECLRMPACNKSDFRSMRTHRRKEHGKSEVYKRSLIFPPEGATPYSRDLNLILAPTKDVKPVRFKVTLDGAAPGDNNGVDSGADGNGEIREPACISSFGRRASQSKTAHLRSSSWIPALRFSISRSVRNFAAADGNCSQAVRHHRGLRGSIGRRSSTCC
jgi:hypothetical protein